MPSDFVSLGQALCYLKKPSEIVDETIFRATRTPKSLPKDRMLRDALIGALVLGEFKCLGTLCVFEWTYDIDQNGSVSREECESRVVDPDYLVPESIWQVDRVDFYLSSLDPEEWLNGFDLNRDDFDSGAWMRVRDLRISVSDLGKLAARVGTAAANSRGGRPANMDFWFEFFAELFVEGVRMGMPIDNDAEWLARTKAMRAKFTKVDETAIVRAMKRFRQLLRERDCLKSNFSR